MKKLFFLLAFSVLSAAPSFAAQDVRLDKETKAVIAKTKKEARKQGRTLIWPDGKMPDAQLKLQFASYREEYRAEDFNPDLHRIPFIEWCPAPEKPNGSCMIVVAGGGYKRPSDNTQPWVDKLTENGFQCVKFSYRTPRPEGLPFYKTAWEDGQRAVRMVRKEASKRGFDPEKIGYIGMSAGAHLGLLLATNSQTRAYEPIDEIDEIPCHINWLLAFSPAYVMNDSNGGRNTRGGYGPDVKIDTLFHFDEKTCPMCLNHGGKDPYSPCGSTQVYRQLRRMKIPAELHLYADMPHKFLGLDRSIEFMRQMGWAGPLEEEVNLMSRCVKTVPDVSYAKEKIWEGRSIPNFDDNQVVPYIEWWIPKNLTTKAIQIIYSGGSYNKNSPDDFEVAPFRKFLNEKGVAVVTMKYRCPRPSKESGLSKHTTAWQDLQRAVRLVRSEAESKGLDPDRIGIMGSSAGGHLTLMGVTSALHPSYLPEDEIDRKYGADVQWGVAIYPAYVLSDGADGHNKQGGNNDKNIIVQDFSFDVKTAPTIFIHGDADGYSSMGSVKTWEKMRSMGIQSDLHTLATRKHCFQKTASPGTGSYTWMEQIWDFLQRKGFVK